MKKIVGTLVMLLAGGALASEPNLATGFGMSAEVGGGVTRFIDTTNTGIDATGGMWTARLTLGTRSHFGGEVAYIGAATPVSSIGLSQNSFLYANGVEGNLRFNLLTGAFQPYATAGVAYRYYKLAYSGANTSSVADSDNVMAIPVAVGAAYRYSGFIADLRLAVSPALSSSLVKNASLSNWDAGLRVGWEF